MYVFIYIRLFGIELICHKAQPNRIEINSVWKP